MEENLLASAFAAASVPFGDPKPVTRIVPDLVRYGPAADASALTCDFNQQNDSWLPEALVLFNTPGLSMREKRNMTDALFPDLHLLDHIMINRMADCNAHIGRLGFSFPQWRFVTQGHSGPSLIEDFGMKKLQRQTDVRDASLPKSDPDRDEFGTGFLHEDKSWTIEYRRAYILCSHKDKDMQTTLVIRNSSYFFGRDRLPAPAYVSFSTHSTDELSALGKKSFTDGTFVKWLDAFKNNDDIPLGEKLQRVGIVLNQLDNIDMQMSRWLTHSGAAKLAAFAEKATTPFYLSQIDSRMPPWFPAFSIPAKEVNFQTLPATFRDGWHKKMVLLSGPDGDLPLKP